MALNDKEEESLGVKLLVVFSLFSYWLVETAAFVLLPLIVYLIVFKALNIEQTKLIELPEWMFISIILHGEFLRKTVIYYSKDKAFNLKAIRQISFGILGIVVSSVFLVFSLIAHYRESFSLSPTYYNWQILIFAWAVFNSLTVSMIIGWERREGHLLAFMNPSESKDEEKNPTDAA